MSALRLRCQVLTGILNKWGRMDSNLGRPERLRYLVARRMNAQRLKWIVVLLGAMAVMLFWSLRRHSPDASYKANVGEVAATTNSHMLLASPANQLPGGAFTAIIRAARELSSAEGKAQALERLRQAFAAGPADQAVAGIRQYLDSKTDAGTGREFKLGDHGSLVEAPTFRTFLLDQLARIDPAAAAEYARTILTSSDSPDEWAMALRSLARGD